MTILNGIEDSFGREEYKDNLYRTTDLQIAALLNLEGYKIIDFELTLDDKLHQNKTRFSFEDNVKIRALISEYKAGKVTVEPNAYMASIKFIKGLIFNLGRQRFGDKFRG